eukprot:7931775-Pyramimonas_sp.AAC.1
MPRAWFDDLSAQCIGSRDKLPDLIVSATYNVFLELRKQNLVMADRSAFFMGCPKLAKILADRLQEPQVPIRKTTEGRDLRGRQRRQDHDASRHAPEETESSCMQIWTHRFEAQAPGDQEAQAVLQPGPHGTNYLQRSCLRNFPLRDPENAAAVR